MLKARSFTIGIAAVVLAASAVRLAAATPGEENLKRRLEATYLKQSVVSVATDLNVALYTGKVVLTGKQEVGLMYHHFHESATLPKIVKFPLGQGWATELKKLDKLDERTYIHKVSKDARVGTAPRGAAFWVRAVECQSKNIDLVLEPKNLEAQGSGMRFRFYFDEDSVIKAGDYAVVNAEIGKYFRLEKQVAAAVEAARNVEIQPGASEQEVIRQLGQPLKSVTVGSQKMLQYRDMVVILKEGKVSEVKLGQ